jgi:AcrR family transcriptional regulator
MPKIDAATVAEHRRQQTQRVMEAATGLFLERGYHGVSLGDIADAIGLRRSSLYRYFPDKHTLALRLTEQALEVQLEREREASSAASRLPRADRVHEWADRQLAYAHTPEHHLIVQLAAAFTDPAPTIAAAHAELGQLLRMLLAEPPACQDPELTADLITSLVVATARAQQRPSADPTLAQATMHLAITALLDAATEPAAA